MKKILITGGTVFVSKYAAEHYVQKGCEVYVLNRNTRRQAAGVHLIEADRNSLGDSLKGYHFDVVMDITAYNGRDIECLVKALGKFEQYIMISSSAVYPETTPQPFTEGSMIGTNKFWGQYGTDKIEAEKALLQMVPKAYIIRPPYLYGPMNNVYRETFVFDCAMQDRIFYLPKDGSMKLQFFHVEDLCRFMDLLIEQTPDTHIFNVGNRDTVTIKEWVQLCYQIAGKEAAFRSIYDNTEQRKYFCFYDYEYYLDVSVQEKILPDTIPLEDGLADAYAWYRNHQAQVNRKGYMDFIDRNYPAAHPRRQFSLL